MFSFNYENMTLPKWAPLFSLNHILHISDIMMVIIACKKEAD